jgi:iron complex outermembrane receptor protein
VLEESLRIGDGLRLSASGAITDAKVKDLQIAPGVPRDTRPTYTPKYSASGRASYTFPGQIAGGELQFGGVITYQSSFYHNARNFAGDLFPERTVVDLNTNWEFENGLRLAAYLKNAFDKRYKTVGLDLATACGCSLEAYGEPRTWGVTVGYRF